MKIFRVILFFCVLGASVHGQELLEKNKIPGDFKVILDVTGTIQFANYYRYSISADGVVIFEYTSRGLPIERRYNLELIPLGEKPKRSKVPKPPKKKKNLSKNQLREIVRVLESSGFFLMKDSYYGDPSATNGTCVNHADAKALSITANGKTKRVYFFLGCSYGDGHELKNFLALFEKIQRMISAVNIREVG